MAMKIKQSPKLPAETRKEQLLDSARALFVKKGYRMTTTEEIARSAGLTKGALYFHFRKKEDILFELIRSIWDTCDKSFQSDLDQPSYPTAFFEALLNFHDACNLTDYWDMIDLWMQGIRIPRVKKYIAKRMVESMAGMGEMLDPEFGGKRKRAQLALFIFALCDGLSFIDHVCPDGVDMKAQIKLFDKMVQGLAIKERESKK